MGRTLPFQHLLDVGRVTLCHFNVIVRCQFHTISKLTVSERLLQQAHTHTITHTHTHTHAYTHASVRAHIQKNIHPNASIHVHTRAYTHAHTHTWIYTNTSLYIPTHVCLHKFFNLHSHTHTHTHTHAHTHTHTHTHTQACIYLHTYVCIHSSMFYACMHSSICARIPFFCLQLCPNSVDCARSWSVPNVVPFTHKITCTRLCLHFRYTHNSICSCALTQVIVPDLDLWPSKEFILYLDPYQNLAPSTHKSMCSYILAHD